MLGELLNTATPLVVAATESEEGLNPLVKVVPGLMIWTLLAFGVAMLVLRKYAWPPISKILDERQTLINDSISSAEKTREEADEVAPWSSLAAVALAKAAGPRTTSYFFSSPLTITSTLCAARMP